MKFLEKLKTIFETKLRDLLSNNNIKIGDIKLLDFSRNTENVLELKKGDRVSIDLSKASDEEKRLVKKDIIDVIVQEDKDAFLIDESSEKTKQIKQNLPKETDSELLKFYKDKLSLDMYRALEASLVVRNVFKKKGNVEELKKDIAKQYPEFGNNLCNLTSQDYFHRHFKDLYLSMLGDEEFDILMYQKKVEKIVKSLPYIVFITRYKSYDELSGEVRFKFGRLQKYGTGKLLLHGIGKENVNTCFSILEEYKNEKGVHVEVDVNPSGTIITATLKF